MQTAEEAKQTTSEGLRKVFEEEEQAAEDCEKEKQTHRKGLDNILKSKQGKSKGRYILREKPASALRKPCPSSWLG